MRIHHQDPRITTEVYGHLAQGYLKKEIDRLRFEPAPAAQDATVIPISAAVTSSDPSGSDQPVHLSAGGASEPPLPADLHTVAAPLLPGFYPSPRSPMHPRRDASESAKDDAELSCRGERDADPGSLYGGRDRLLRVAEVAEHLGVCAATVYRLCETGELAHVRIVNSIRIRPDDLRTLQAARRKGHGED